MAMAIAYLALLFNLASNLRRSGTEKAPFSINCLARKARVNGHLLNSAANQDRLPVVAAQIAAEHPLTKPHRPLLLSNSK